MDTSTIQNLGFNDLVRQAKEHEAYISEIKDEVAAEADNINNPEPLFSQLEPASAE